MTTFGDAVVLNAYAVYSCPRCPWPGCAPAPSRPPAPCSRWWHPSRW